MKKKQNEQRERLISEQTTVILNELATTDSEKNEEIKLELITMLKQFCERKGIHEQIEETIPDRRNQDVIVYSKQSLMMSAMMIFLFRMASGNGFDVKSHDNDNKYSKANVAKFIEAPEDCVPVIKTIEKFLTNLEMDRGTENEKVKWQHNMLVFSFIFLGGLKIPIYRHCIRAKQVVNLECASDSVHKQLCLHKNRNANWLLSKQLYLS